MFVPIQVWRVETLDSSKQIAHCSTNSAYWMIDVGFSPNGDQVVTLCDTIEVQVDTFTSLEPTFAVYII